MFSVAVFLCNKYKFLKMQAPSFLHYVNVSYGTAVLSEYSVGTEAVICSVVVNFHFQARASQVL